MIKIKKFIFALTASLLIFVKANAGIQDSIIATVGNEPITKSDILNEIKIILILSNQSYSQEKRERLYELAMQSTIKRIIKKIEIDRNNYLQFSVDELNKRLEFLSGDINMDVETLKNICSSNDLDFTLIENQIKIELLWNSLIYQIYKDRVSINSEEINEQLKLIDTQKVPEEYLISEIVIKYNTDDVMESVIEKVKNDIDTQGFDLTARNISISETATKGGDLGWVNENVIAENIRTIIAGTKIGEISEPIILPKGILIFQVRDKRKKEITQNAEEMKNDLINIETSKILTMYSKTHYDQLRRSISIKFFDE